MSMSNTTKRVKEIRRNTRRKFSSEEKIRIVLDGLRGESSIAELCRQEGIQNQIVRVKLVEAEQSGFTDKNCDERLAEVKEKYKDGFPEPAVWKKIDNKR